MRYSFIIQFNLEGARATSGSFIYERQFYKLHINKIKDVLEEQE